jgi:hypothetical protein
MMLDFMLHGFAGKLAAPVDDFDKASKKKQRWAAAYGWRR